MGFVVRFEVSQDIAKSNAKELTEARDIIEKNSPTHIDGNSRPGTIKKENLVRLDLQGLFNRPDKKRYANLQIQLNKHRYSELDMEFDDFQETEEDVEGATAEFGKPKSTTIAIVLMPCNTDIPESISKQAFYGSLKDKMKAIIEEK